MTTPAPTPGYTKVLLPVAGIVLMAVGGLFVARQFTHSGSGQGSPTTSGTSNTGESYPAVIGDLKVGTVLPDFQLHPYQANGTYAVSSLKSKVNLINFWATWCEACMIEMPSIVALHQGYKDRGFDVLAVNLDQNPDTVLPRTIQKYKMGFTVFTDQDSHLADLFQIQAIPLTVVVDQNRKILMIENEGIDWNGSQFRAALEKWLSG